MGITIICNICLFISTALKIVRHKKDTAHHLRGSESRRHDDNKQWSDKYYRYITILLMRRQYIRLRTALSIWYRLVLNKMIIFRRRLSHAVVCFHNYEIFWRNKHIAAVSTTRARFLESVCDFRKNDKQSCDRIKSKWTLLFHKD